MSEEPEILIAMPVDYPGYVVPGSFQHQCQNCRCAVWVAPSSWLMMREHPGMEVYCWDCAFIKMKKDPGEIMEVTPAQRQEVEEWRNKREAERGG